MLRKIIYLFNKLDKVLQLLLVNHYFGFVSGHAYLSNKQVTLVRKYIGLKNNHSDELNTQFEESFSELIGKGESISFAAGRMAFFSLMKHLRISKGDEVIIQAANCSVMINAILRTGATPIFADIDEETLGTSPTSITNLITLKTKLIVAQHSFGIPCKIDEIVQIGHENDIFVLEDCALTVDSTFKGITIGNWGDAAIFSTDHTKPINTIIGGLLYSNNKNLIRQIKSYRNTLSDLSFDHQMRLFRQFKFERRFFNPDKNMNGKITSILKGVLQRFRLLKSRNIFLEDDYNVPRELKNPNYLYPAKLPAFIAKIGLFEIEKWEQTKHTRIRIFKKYKSLFEEFGFSEYLPKAYNDTGIQIVPVRFVLSHPDANNIKNLFKLYLDIESTWFMAPIIVCSEPSELGYRYGSCNQAELFGERALNFPCALNNIDANRLIKLLTETLTNQKNVNKI